MAKLQERLTCQACGIEAPLRAMEFRENVGALVVRYHKTVRGSLCKGCGHKYFWQMTLKTLAIGWLGTISLFVAPVFVLLNIANYLRILGMPAAPKGAGKPVLTQTAIQQLTPFSTELMSRVQSPAQVIPVARDVAARAGVTPGQAMQFIFALNKSQVQQQVPQTAPLPPLPLAPLPIAPDPA